MYQQMANRVTLMMTPSLPILAAQHLLRLFSGFTTLAGKEYRLFSRPEKVSIISSLSFKHLSRDVLMDMDSTALNEAKVEVRVQYKDVTQGIFKDIARNELVMRIQPSEAIYLKFNCKTPGLYSKSMPTEMDLTYKRRFSDIRIPEAYEALILDSLKGDSSNFVRHDELDVAWKVSPIPPWVQ
jgi:hypothetical protein